MPKPVPLPEQLKRIEAFASRLGVSPQICLNEALEDWLTIVAPARISHFEKSDNVTEFSVGKERQSRVS